MLLRFGVTIPVIASVACIAACAVGPNYARPSQSTGQDYSTHPFEATATAPDVAGGTEQEFVMGRDIPFTWWAIFDSPKLNALLERALKNNPNIAAAQAALRSAQETVQAQRGYYYPSVTAEFIPERQKLAGNLGGNSPGVQGNGSVISTYQNPNGPPYNAPVIFNMYTAQLNVGYTPDVFGANRRQVESLQAQADSLRYEMEATYITLAGNVVAAAIQEASLREQVQATQAFIEQNLQALAILHDQKRFGYAMGLDVAAQESAVALAQQQLPPLQKQLEQTHDLLRALLGDTPDTTVDFTFEFSSLSLPKDLPVSLPARLIEQRPDVRAAEEQLHFASAQVGVAVAARLPQFTLSGSVGGVASEVNQLFSPGGPFWTLVGDATQPLFAGFTLLHRERAAEEALVQAQAQYRSTVLTALQNVADTLHAITTDAESLAACSRSERAAKATVDITEAQYRAGYVNYLTLLGAKEAYQTAVIARLQAQANRYGDTAALFQALGGGWWNREQAANGVSSRPAGAVPIPAS
ncbi:MAG: efflux transporter outer membrane subunit [Burkholderiaceae bacterium]